MVSGRVLMTDSTHIKANANKHRFKAQVVHERTKSYLSELDKAIEADRLAHQKKPLRPREEVTEEREIKVSLTDPDSGYMYREGKPEGFYYLDYRTVDAKYNVITDVHITPGNVHDSVPYTETANGTFWVPSRGCGIGLGISLHAYLSRIGAKGNLRGDWVSAISSDARSAPEVEVQVRCENQLIYLPRESPTDLPHNQS